MKNIILFLSVLLIVGCSGKKKVDDFKDQEVQGSLEKGQTYSQTGELGVNKDKVIVARDRVVLVEKLKQLNFEVKALQDEVYGVDEYQSRGSYGDLEKCLTKKKIRREDSALAKWPRKNFLTTRLDLKKENVGYDEKGQLVGLDEKSLSVEMDRLENAKEELGKDRESLQIEIQKCKAL